MTRRIDRRRFLAVAGGGTLATAIAGCSDDETVEVDASTGEAQVDVPNDLDEYLGDANGYDQQIIDLTNERSVTIAVGAGSEGLQYDPVAFRIEKQTTISWVWTGKGGAHDVTATEDSFRALDSDEPVAQAGEEWDYAVSGDAVHKEFKYFCSNHRDEGMKGGFEVVP